MTRRTKLWLYGSLLFALLNAGGALYAARLGEPSHAATHAVLLLVGLFVAWRVSRRALPQVTQPTTAAPLFDERLDRLQQSLDAIAVEVERVEEGQRYVMKLGQQAGKTE